MASDTKPRANVDAPLWDQGTFYGRFRHYVWMTNPGNCLHSEDELIKAKNLVESYRLGQEPPGTTEEKVHHAMKLYASSFHPDSKELQNVFGRMSFQVPGGMVITGAMLAFYKSTPQVVFWQWFNQSFNALVNYTNRNAEAEVSVAQLGGAYVSATASALIAALGLKKVLEARAPPVFQRFVPLVAVVSANAVNIPFMRQTELIDGVDLRDENGDKACKSRTAAAKGISQVVAGRNVIVTPGMLTIPLIQSALERRFPKFAKATWAHAPFQTLCVGTLLMLMVPVGCAVFPQQCEVKTESLKKSEPAAFKELITKYGSEEKIPETLYFNKGL